MFSRRRNISVIAMLKLIIIQSRRPAKGVFPLDHIADCCKKSGDLSSNVKLESHFIVSEDTCDHGKMEINFVTCGNDEFLTSAMPKYNEEQENQPATEH